MSLDELRRKIDETDARIVRLIAERTRIAEEIGQEKRKQGKQIEDAVREHTVMENVRSIARQENLEQEDIESIYRQIMAVSKSLQGIVVAFQGELGHTVRKPLPNFLDLQLRSNRVKAWTMFLRS